MRDFFFLFEYVSVQKSLRVVFFYSCVQERDAERRRQLRERARQLIAEARSGVKMSDMSLLDPSSSGKGGKAGTAGGQLTQQQQTWSLDREIISIRTLFIHISTLSEFC